MKSHKKSLRSAIARDIKAGTAYEQVVRKYAVSHGLVRKLSEELARDKLISENDFRKFLNTEGKAVASGTGPSPVGRMESPPRVQQILNRDFHRSNEPHRKAVEAHPAVAQPEESPAAKAEQATGGGDYQPDIELLARIARDIKSGMTCEWLLIKYPVFGSETKILLEQMVKENMITVNDLHRLGQTIRNKADTDSVVAKDGKVKHPKTENRGAAGGQQGTESSASTSGDSGVRNGGNRNVGRVRWVIVLMPIAVGLLSHHYWGNPAFYYGLFVGLGIMIAAMWLLVKAASFSPDGAAMVIGTVSLIAIFYVCFTYTGANSGNYAESYAHLGGTSEDVKGARSPKVEDTTSKDQKATSEPSWLGKTLDELLGIKLQYGLLTPYLKNTPLWLLITIVVIGLIAYLNSKQREK